MRPRNPPPGSVRAARPDGPVARPDAKVGVLVGGDAVRAAVGLGGGVVGLGGGVVELGGGVVELGGGVAAKESLRLVEGCCLVEVSRTTNPNQQTGFLFLGRAKSVAEGAYSPARRLFLPERWLRKGKGSLKEEQPREAKSQMEVFEREDLWAMGDLLRRLLLARGAPKVWQGRLW